MNLCRNIPQFWYSLNHLWNYQFSVDDHCQLTYIIYRHYERYISAYPIKLFLSAQILLKYCGYVLYDHYLTTKYLRSLHFHTFRLYAELIDMSVVERTTHNLTDYATVTFIVRKFIIPIVIANLVSVYKSHNMETPCNDVCFYGDYCLKVHLFSFWSQLI